jgi:eukaryotic-like serine/threonine-protein kinase
VAGLLESVGKPDEALAAYRKAEALVAGLVRAEPASAVAPGRTALAACRSDLVELLSVTGQVDEGLKVLRTARAEQELLTADRPTSEALDELAHTIDRIAVLLDKTGKASEALTEYRAAVAIRKDLADHNPTVPYYRAEVASSDDSIGSSLGGAGQWDQATVELRRSVAIYQKLAGDNPTQIGYQRTLAWNHHAIANLQRRAGRPGEAMGHYQPALDIMEKLVQQNPSIADYRDSAAVYGNDAISALLALGRIGEARILSDRSVPRLEELVRTEPGNVEYRGNLAESLLRRGQVRRAEGDLVGAGADWNRAAVLYRDSLDPRATERVCAACCHAGLSSIARQPGSADPASKGPVEASRAMDLLHQAVAAGFVERDWLRTESGLDPLRDRPDFQLLMMDLAFPAEPIAR